VTNALHFGDNLDVLRAMPERSVDLIYLDPPFNSHAGYNVLYGTKRGGPSQAQAHTFDDTWTWGPTARRAIEQTAQRHLRAGTLLDAFAQVFPDSPMLAYLAMMAVRLIEMNRVLKDTGSIYLHCDPTASHYLKVVMDAIFGPPRFLNELIWKRTSAHSSAKRYGPIHDTLLFYSKSDEYTWNRQYLDYDEDYLDTFFDQEDKDGHRWKRTDLTGAGTRNGETGLPWRGIDVTAKGRHWAYPPSALDKLDAEGKVHWPLKDGGMPRLKQYPKDLPGVPLQDLILDIKPDHNLSRQRTGFSTQKPLPLIERLIRASSNEGDTVLDPFCGCGTAIEAAQNLRRKWVGIDVTYLAIHVIEKRLVEAFGEGIKEQYRLYGRPMDANDAIALAGRDWLEFQKWAVMVLGGLPKDRPGPDGGIDGIIRYHRVGLEQPNRAVVSVKGGRNVGVDAIHKLKSVVAREKAEMGVLVCLEPPTSAMVNEVTSEGDVGPVSRRVSKLQIVTVKMLFQAQPIEFPGTVDPPEIGRPSIPFPRPPSSRRRQLMEGQAELLLPLPDGKGAEKPRLRGRAIRDVQIEVTRPTFDRKTR
jgi:DNA modification methylase